MRCPVTLWVKEGTSNSSLEKVNICDDAKIDRQENVTSAPRSPSVEGLTGF